jgi:Flp pilus assembly pilin Flp
MKPSATPAVIDSNDANPVEVGVKFSASTSGYITGLRFYKATTNVGTHVGHIWSSSGTLLGSATFTNETASGWQQVTFATPIQVSANTTYIASYFAPEGHYSATTNFFATTGVSNPPLQALANGVSGPNGVYLYSSAGGFPSNSYESTYYWVDVVYTASQSTSASGQVTIMKPSATPAVIDSNDANPVEVGVKFSASTSGYITGLRFYKATTNVGTHVGHIWSSSGTLLGSATFTNETASGWQQVTFAMPIQVSANTTYIASYFAPKGHYSATTNFFATTGVSNPPLQALANGVSGPNGVYLYSSTGGFPTDSYESTYYWVDVVYTESQSTSGTGTAGNSQLTLGATSLSFGSVSTNTSTTQSLTLTSSGTAAVTVNSASIAGADFSIVGATFPITLNPNQSTTLQVQFEPTAAGSATGSLTISSNSASGATTVVSLSGTGTTAVSSSVELTWDAPSSSSVPVAGYYVYRSTGSGAAQLMNSSIDTQTSYIDTSVVAGSTYSYYVKSVDSSGVQSTASNEIPVTIP